MPVCLVAIQLVYSDNDWFAGFLCLTDEKLGSNLNALGCVNQNDAAVANCKGRINSTDKVIGTRSVYDVELGVEILRVKESGVNRSLINLLYLGVVTHCVFGLDRATAVDDLALEHHTFRKGGLSGFRTTQQNDIPYVFGFVCLHCY